MDAKRLETIERLVNEAKDRKGGLYRPALLSGDVEPNAEKSNGVIIGTALMAADELVREMRDLQNRVDRLEGETAILRERARTQEERAVAAESARAALRARVDGLKRALVSAEAKDDEVRDDVESDMRRTDCGIPSR